MQVDPSSPESSTGQQIPVERVARAGYNDDGPPELI